MDVTNCAVEPFLPQVTSIFGTARIKKEDEESLAPNDHNKQELEYDTDEESLAPNDHNKQELEYNTECISAF